MNLNLPRFNTLINIYYYYLKKCVFVESISPWESGLSHILWQFWPKITISFLKICVTHKEVTIINTHGTKTWEKITHSSTLKFTLINYLTKGNIFLETWSLRKKIQLISMILKILRLPVPYGTFPILFVP